MAKIPINLVTGTLQKDELIVGIDLGTTNSLIAIVHPDTRKAIVLKEYDNSSLVPSVVYLDNNDIPIVGEEAKDYLEKFPERTIYSVKRLMGKNYNDIKESKLAYNIIETDDDRLVRIRIGDKSYTPIDLSSIILKKLKERAEHILKTPINKAVITVPAYFNDSQRQATKDAGKLAGLDVLRIINEPTAASLAYGISNTNTKGKVAVYDLGGGTFDISILDIDDGVFEVLSTNGDTYLGGDDLDKAIINYFIERNSINTENLMNKNYVQQLRLLAEKAKKYLSDNDSFSETVNGTHFEITKAQFEKLIEPIIEKTINCCKNAVDDAEITIDDIEKVIMVGGSTRIPLVRQMVGKFFNTTVDTSINPDEAVALGAAIQADILAGNTKEFLLLDVTPLSLGVETMGGLMDVIIPRNSKIPSKAGRQYTTQKDGQSGMIISVYQGERDLVENNRKLGEFTLKGIPAMPAGLAKVDISFQLNADGILNVSAKEIRSGISQSVEIKPQLGLDDTMLEAMLMDSITHAKDDIAKRALVEAQTEAEQLLQVTEKFITKNSNLLSASEIQSTALAMQSLQMAIDLKDKDLIRAKHDELNNITKPFAERVMDEAIGQALKGKSML